MEFMIYLLLTVFSITAVYGLSYVLVYSRGAFGMFSRVRDISWVQDFGILECLPCISFWISMPVAFLAGHDFWFISWLGVWGCVVIVDRIISEYLVK